MLELITILACVYIAALVSFSAFAVMSLLLGMLTKQPFFFTCADTFSTICKKLVFK